MLFGNNKFTTVLIFLGFLAPRSHFLVVPLQFVVFLSRKCLCVDKSSPPSYNFLDEIDEESD